MHYEWVVVLCVAFFIIGTLFGWNNGRASLKKKLDTQVYGFRHDVQLVKDSLVKFWDGVKAKL